MVTDYRNKKVYDYLKDYPRGRVLFIFNHGLGDLINFLPLYDKMVELFPRCTFKIGTPISRKNGQLHPQIISLGDGFRATLQYYSHIFRINYPEPSIEDRNQGLIKPYICNLREMGIPNFVWKTYDFKYNINTSKLKRIGFHFTGDTNHSLKNIDFKIIEKMWREVDKLGYEPFDVHSNTGNTKFIDYPSFINNNNSLRFQKFDIKELISIIKSCKYFIGIESGPLYLANSILGSHNVIGVENKMKISWYLPEKIIIIDSKQYGDLQLTKLLSYLESR